MFNFAKSNVYIKFVNCSLSALVHLNVFSYFLTKSQKSMNKTTVFVAFFDLKRALNVSVNHLRDVKR